MIHILFVSGSFGSMLEWSVRSYSSEYDNPMKSLKPDGSMHNHRKINHPINYNQLLSLDTITDPSSIITPIYPMADSHVDKIIEFYNNSRFNNDRRILINIPNINVAELIIMMQYYKISIGLNHTLDSIFNNEVCKENITKWNPHYTHWNEMQPWELREWFSLFYPGWASEWIDISKYVSDEWLIIEPYDLINDYNKTIKQVIDFCGLEYIKNELADKISKSWLSLQQPIIEEYNKIEQIVKYSIKNEFFEWGKLNILLEAMIQKKLRDHGYELKCYGLNDFPCNSTELYKVLDR